MEKKRGPTNIELMQAYFAVKNSKSSLDNSNEGTSNQPEEASAEQRLRDDFSQHMDRLMAMIESRLSSVPQKLNFSNATKETLTELNIVFQCVLVLKSGLESRIEKSKENGKDELWSSKQMHLHLALLERLFPKRNETNCRAWIDTFFFRVSSMIAPGNRMLLNMEQSIPATVLPSSLNTIAGFTDYTAVVAGRQSAVFYFDDPSVSTAKCLHMRFFVTEAKMLGELHKHIPQALCQLYVTGKQFEKQIIRGALTNGREWIFIILYINNDGNGASYKYSVRIRYPVFHTSEDWDARPLKPWPDVVAGILSDWVQSSFEDLGEDDWFEEVCGR